MTVATTEAPESFRIGMLWTDTRYRSYTIQIIALVIFMLFFAWIIDNTIKNLAALGKDFRFSFMNDPASYDINQRIIEYTSRSSHSTAAVVGVLNTLLIAVLGCIAATIIGVVAGVLRLSKNWIVSKLMTVYIEGVRNVPVLLQILLWSAFFSESLSPPKQAEQIYLFWFIPTGVVPTNRGFYLPGPEFGAGSWLVIAALVLGFILSIAFSRYAKRRQRESGELLPSFKVGAALIIGLPVVAYFIAGQPIGVETPELKGFNYKGGIFARESLISLWLALSLYTGAFIAENVRSGILAVSHGQTEAAYALGLRPNWTMRLIVLPQALRVIIPPLISQYLNLTKNSSLAIAVGYMDATGTLGGITLNQTGREMETLLLLMGFYLIISLSISAIMNLYNENVKLVERTSSYGAGFGFLTFFHRLRGEREMITRGEARDHSAYGVTGWLNLVMLFYAAMFVAMLYFVFISTDRPGYFTWPLSWQAPGLLSLLLLFSVNITGLFKNPRFFDFLILELIVFIIAALTGFPFHLLVPGVTWTAFFFGGLIIRFCIIYYVAVGRRPNVTYFTQVKSGDVA